MSVLGADIVICGEEMENNREQKEVKEQCGHDVTTDKLSYCKTLTV